MKIGVLTGGGDCAGLNAVIRAVVKTAIRQYGWQVYGINDSYDGLLFPGKVHRLTLEDVKGKLPVGGTMLGTRNRGDPFAYPNGGGPGSQGRDLSQQAIERSNQLGLDAIIVIGGDGTLTIAQRFFEKGMNVVGVPKTIDNDLTQTDITFGFRTAVKTATEALDKVHSTAASHDRVMVVEVMGRYAGWIALESGIAGGAHVILIPEIPFDMEKVCAKILERKASGSEFSVIVVSEGATPIGGSYTLVEEARDGHVARLGGIGEKVASEVSHHVGMEGRVVVLGHLQRGGGPNAFDRVLATCYGVHAVNLVAEGKYGMMACMRGMDLTEVPIKEAIARLKTVPLDSHLIRTAEAIGISFGR